MSPGVVEDLIEDAKRGGGRGLGRKARIFISASSILFRVVRRYLKRRDHGFYATVVEEICRELYLTNIGAVIWGLMKGDARQTFEYSTGPTRGGRYFVERLGEECHGGSMPEVSVVAHSAGSVWATHLIAHVDQARKDPAHPLLRKFRLTNVIFLAPAVRFDLFAKTLAAHGSVIRRFRMFTMDDPHESGYWEIPLVYPRSLLYLVSGMFETEGNMDTSFDMPLLGMERYYRHRRVYRAKAIRDLRRFLLKRPTRAIWSVEFRGKGLNADAVRHGGFDSIKKRKRVMESALSML